MENTTATTKEPFEHVKGDGCHQVTAPPPTVKELVEKIKAIATIENPLQLFSILGVVDGRVVHHPSNFKLAVTTICIDRTCLFVVFEYINVCWYIQPPRMFGLLEREVAYTRFLPGTEDIHVSTSYPTEYGGTEKRSMVLSKDPDKPFNLWRVKDPQPWTEIRTWV